MMTVKEYADELELNIVEVLNRCHILGIDVSAKGDTLSDEAITLLDNYVEEESDEQELLSDEQPNQFGEVNSVQKLKKKTDVIKSNKKDLAKKKKDMYKSKEKLKENAPSTNDKVVLYTENMSIGELANELDIGSGELIKKLFMLGIMATINSAVSFENAELLASEYGKELKKEETADITNFEEFEVLDDPKDLVKRPPVVTIMGHVDHGKTTLLDYIRSANVVATEAGGITQAISAYQVEYSGEKITFIDTPGHAAFTEMRARGAGITDIVIIIVAADDGIMPQTKEAIDHAKAAGVPIIVAINKMDKPGANPERIMTELSEYGLMPDAWGGDTLYNKIVATTGEGVNDLLENILLIAEMNAYKANPRRYAIGSVVESRLDKHTGAVVTLIVQNGTLRLGDPIVVGTTYGKVRTLKNDKGEEITAASPSLPVEITGLNEVPVAGDKFMSFETDKQARSIGEHRKNQSKLLSCTVENSVTLDDLFSKIQSGIKEINVIVKTDVNGSSEAIKNTLEKLEVEEVRIKVIRSSVGAITESDIVLAKASHALLIGFNVRPAKQIKDYAAENCVEIRLYNIIYKIVEDLELAMKGMLDPVFEEKILGTAEVRQIFKFSKVGIIAGSYITDGVIRRNSQVRVIRENIVVFDGEIASIQREKDDAKEVKKGLECGITIKNYKDLKVGDIIEAYEMVEVKK